MTSGVARIWCQGARRSRRRRRENRGDKGAEWGGVWGGVSAPQTTSGSGRASWAPPAGSGAEPRPLSHFLHILGHRAFLVARKIRFSCPKYKFHFEKVVLTVTTTSKSGGDKSPSSHTKLRLWICSLGHGLHTFTAVPVLTQPSILSGTIKWVSAFRLSNSNKRRWWMWMAAAYWRTHKPSRLAWSEGWQPPSAECAFITWTRCTLAMALATMTVR